MDMDMKQATLSMGSMVMAFVELAESGKYGLVTAADQALLDELVVWLSHVYARITDTTIPPVQPRVLFKMPGTDRIVEAADMEEAQSIINAERVAQGKPPLDMSRVGIRHVQQVTDAERILGGHYDAPTSGEPHPSLDTPPTPPQDDTGTDQGREGQ